MSHRTNLHDKVGQVNATFPNVRRMTPSNVRALQEPFVFVDCRSKEERDVSKIDVHALSIEEFEDQLDDIVDRDVIIICHCTVGIRSARFVSKHQDRVEKIYTMPGGILSWIDEGYSIYLGTQNNEGPPSLRETRRVHPCLKEFVSLAPEGYECVYTV